MTKVEFLKRVSSVDPKAAKELDRIMVKANQDMKYKGEILYDEDGLYQHSTAARVLTWLFTWEYTAKGSTYWEQLFSKLEVADL